MTTTISRRQILSRSRDAGLDAMQKFPPFEDCEEMWFSTEQLFKDHIAEVLQKWEQIDDEIWAKMIFMSRNRRIAKAYIRVQQFIINGSEDGFDGFKLGLNGFDDPFRDAQTDKLMDYIDECRIGIETNGNMVLKRLTNYSGVYVKSFPSDFSESVASNSVIHCNGALDVNKPYVIFDMAKFEAAMVRELKSEYPDRRKLEQKCIVVLAFVRNHPSSILDSPIYIMFINIVALDLLKSKMNLVIYQSISQREPSHRLANTRPSRGTIHHPQPHHGNGNHHMASSHHSNYNNNNSRVSGRNETRIRVPDFVSIFNVQPGHSPHASEDDFDDEDTIYGRIGDHSYSGSRHRGGVSDDYITASDYEYRRFGPPTNRNFSPKLRNFEHESGNYGPSLGLSCPSYPYSASTRSTRPGPLPPLPRDSFHHGNADSSEPPKLPPRDKKKLSKQINTIKKSRHAPIDDPYSVQIPSPDYLMDDRQESFAKNSDSQRKSWSTMKGHQTVNRMGKYSDQDRDHIYDTMSRSKSMVMPSGGKQKLNSIKMTASTIHLPPKSAPQLGYRERMIDEEDPYYSGLEARITSKKHLDPKATSSKKGLGAMMRKVLSSNYINILTSKRHKAASKSKSKPNSKSSIDSSTDSDPYASINEVYEPIYGYTTGLGSSKGYSNPFWPTMTRTSKKH